MKWVSNVTSFLVGLLIIPAIAYAATYTTWEEIETAIEEVLQVRHATGPNGERMLVAKIDNATIQDITGIRKCWVTNVDSIWDQTLDTWELFTAFRTRVPEEDFATYEHLCWPIWVTRGYAGTLDTAGIDLAVNRLAVVPPGIRCDATRPFDGAGRDAPNNGNWDGWHWVGTDTGNDDSVGVVAQCHLQGG